MLDDVVHMLETLAGECWQVVRQGQNEFEGLVLPVGLESGLVYCGCFLVDATARDNQIGLWRKGVGDFELDMTSDHTGAEDVVADNVAQLLRQGEQKALSLGICGVA
jgi:hypothetical protein